MLLYNNKNTPNQKIYTKFATTESGQNHILEKKVHITDPFYFG